MEMGDGMVAVVRGLPDAALAVTLLDGPRQYTLLPNSAVHSFMSHEGPDNHHVPQKPACIHVQRVPQQQCPPDPHEPHLVHQPPPLQHHPLYEHQPGLQQQVQPALQYQCTGHHAGTDPPDLKQLHHDSAAQAVDGRYASVYKTAHCRVQPTSPPLELTEFPPQRAQRCRVRGNFEVCGVGKETSSSVTRHDGTCRGALTWPDTGTVFVPRQSREPDAFANSLRKYPALSPDRSSEVMERLLNYSHKNGSGGRQQGSPQRAESHSPAQLCDRRSSITASLRAQRHSAEYKMLSRWQGSSGDRSPSRPSEPEQCRPLYPRSYLVRHMRDVTARAPCPYTQPAYQVKERFDLPSSDKPELDTVNLVNTETQAEIMMVSREVATEPLEKISKRNVAVSPSASVSLPPAPRRRRERARCSRLVQTQPLLAVPLPFATLTRSSTHIPSDRGYSLARRSRSSEKLTKHDHTDALLPINKELDKCANENEEATSKLFSKFLKVKRNDAVFFVNSVVYDLRDVFTEPTQPPLRDRGRQKMMLVDPQRVNDSSVQTTHECNKTSNFIQATDQDPEKGLDGYHERLVREIKAWMESVRELRAVDVGSRETVAAQLAGDIIDRHRYLELDPGSGGSQHGELDYLKYQMYKRMNKLVREDHLNMIAHASRLLNKLKRIPVSGTAESFRSVGTDPSPPPHCRDHVDEGESNRSSGVKRKEPPRDSIVMAAHVDQKRRQSGPAACSGCSGPEPGAGRPRSTSVREGSPYSADTDRPESPQGAACLAHAAPRAASDGSSPPQATSERGGRVSSPPGLQMTAERSGQTGSPGSVVTDVPQRRAPAGAPAAPCGRRSGRDTTGSPQPTDLFDDFLKNWVRQIPIHTSDPEEIALLDKMRLGIYVGVWKAITKLQMNPTAGSNPFYYRDLLEDELDELLNLLPDSCELHGARPRLKAQLIETATAARQRFTFADTSASYKRQLVDSVVRNIPRRTIDRTDVNVDRLVEEVHRLRLADDYIMYVANRDRDRVKANVYRNKLEKHVQRLIDDIKRSEGEGARDGAPHRDDIMKALHRVPPPGEDIIREEAALVLLGAEVEQWSADLPLHPPADPVEALARRRHRNVLTKKLHDLDRRVGLAACEPQLRQEVRKFIEKLPLIADENDVDFMVDELVNRLRNMPADTATGGGWHVAEPGGFHDFSRDLPLCSSRSEAHGGESYMIVGGERVDSCSPSAPHVQRRQNLTPESQQQWYTLEETGPPPSDDPRQTCGVRCSVVVQTPAAVSFREPAEDSAPRPPGYVNSSAPPVDPRREKDDTRAYEREKRQSTVATSSPCCGRTSETVNRAVPRGQTSVGTGQSSQSCRQTSRDTGYGTRGPSPAAASTERHSRAAQVQTSSSLQEEEEEVRCHCTERVWRRRKPPPLGVACDDYDVDFPPCFPVRYACPYYF